MQLLYQPLSDIPRSRNKKIQLFISGFKKFFMQNINGFLYILAGNNGGNISFRRSLCNGPDIDTVPAQNTK